MQRRFGRFTLVQAELKTGRTHQIRVHLAHSGFPIVGDDKYGDDAIRDQFARQGFKRMFLHSGRLSSIILSPDSPWFWRRLCQRPVRPLLSVWRSCYDALRRRSV